MDSKIEKRRKRLTVLLIPDDDTEPFSLNISIRALKVIAGLALVLLIHIILGATFYWQYAVLSKENDSLVRENDDLKITRERVYRLLPEVAELQRKNDKMLNALGVSRRSYPFSHTNPLEANQAPPTFSAEGDRGEIKPQQPGSISESIDFLKEKDSQYHDFVRNMPTRLPVAGYMSQDFNLLSWFSVENNKSHLGIDIVADIGTPIHAAGDGFVVFSDWTFPMGNLIIIYHGSGFFTYYGHNHRNVVVEKTTVRKGEVIGFVGNSGKSSGPHLHFEVWRNGSPLDPKEVLLSFQ